MDKRTQINKFLTEKIFGECWHEVLGMSMCIHCHKPAGYPFDISNPDFFTWPGLGKLKDFLEKERPEEWHEFMFTKWGHGYHPYSHVSRYACACSLINPEVFAEAVAKFLGWKEL